MTQVTFKSVDGMGWDKPVVLHYWNGVMFTSKPAAVENYDAAAMWAWLEENAGIVAAFPTHKELTVTTL